MRLSVLGWIAGCWAMLSAIHPAQAESLTLRYAQQAEKSIGYRDCWHALMALAKDDLEQPKPAPFWEWLLDLQRDRRVSFISIESGFRIPVRSPLKPTSEPYQTTFRGWVMTVPGGAYLLAIANGSLWANLREGMSPDVIEQLDAIGRDKFGIVLLRLGPTARIGDEMVTATVDAKTITLRWGQAKMEMIPRPDQAENQQRIVESLFKRHTPPPIARRLRTLVVVDWSVFIANNAQQESLMPLLRETLQQVPSIDLHEELWLQSGEQVQTWNLKDFLQAKALPEPPSAHDQATWVSLKSLLKAIASDESIDRTLFITLLPQKSIPADDQINDSLPKTMRQAALDRGLRIVRLGGGPRIPAFDSLVPKRNVQITADADGFKLIERLLTRNHVEPSSTK